MMTFTGPAIHVQELVKVYRGSGGKPVRALDGLTLEVRQGEIFGLLGRNGAGKTTLLRVLTTLVPPTSGSARVMGMDVQTHGLDVRRSICAVLQENAVEIFLSVDDNLATYARFQGVPRAEARRRADRALEVFGLTEYRSQKVIDLSGGLKRRVQVAKVFMADKPIVFLDEATTGMDPLNKRATLDAIREEARPRTHHPPDDPHPPGSRGALQHDRDHRSRPDGCAGGSSRNHRTLIARVRHVDHVRRGH